MTRLLPPYAQPMRRELKAGVYQALMRCLRTVHLKTTLIQSEKPRLGGVFYMIKSNAVVR